MAIKAILQIIIGLIEQPEGQATFTLDGAEYSIDLAEEVARLVSKNALSIVDRLQNVIL